MKLLADPDQVAVTNGHSVSDTCTSAFEKLPETMDAADAREGAIERAVIDLAEAVLLSGREKDIFST